MAYIINFADLQMMKDATIITAAGMYSGVDVEFVDELICMREAVFIPHANPVQRIRLRNLHFARSQVIGFLDPIALDK